ncbi:hypothetical protein [Streptomyces sp. NRRL S-350]|uniref:hypothetical protein n=1 Tax=Streptomyces sp. NRRL S-350 TaxID=1463902 RepID=UPI0004BF073E|nr:hypothetical protein [Streptomyces sp. NRRL S-350]
MNTIDRETVRERARQHSARVADFRLALRGGDPATIERARAEGQTAARTLFDAQLEAGLITAEQHCRRTDAISSEYPGTGVQA